MSFLTDPRGAIRAAVADFRAKVQAFRDGTVYLSRNGAAMTPEQRAEAAALLERSAGLAYWVEKGAAAVDTALEWLGGLLDEEEAASAGSGVGELGLLPLFPLAALAVIAASAAALGKWVSDYLSLRARIEQQAALVASGVSPERAAMLTKAPAPAPLFSLGMGGTLLVVAGIGGALWWFTRGRR